MPRPVEYACHFDAAGHCYTDHRGEVHRSVTQILNDCGCVDFSMVDAATLQQAAERGTAVHQLSLTWDKVRGHCDLPFFLDGVPEELHGYLWQYEAFLQQTGFKAIVEETERPRIVDIQGVKVGMTPDRIGHFPNAPQLVVLDLKTGGELFAHPLQIAAYSMGVEKVMALAMQHVRLALYLEPDYYRMKFFRHAQDYYAFLDALFHGGGAYLKAWKEQRQRNLVA
jgi:hypothetical protein